MKVLLVKSWALNRREKIILVWFKVNSTLSQQI